MLVRNQFYRLLEAADENLEGGAPPSDPPSDPAPPADPPADPPPSDPAPSDPPADPAPKGKGDEGYWPNDWRKNIAGEDEKLLKRLERYASPKALSDALVSVQNRISAGELRGVLPKNATEEQVKQWREENGIPESPDKYELALPKGLVIGEDDKPIIDDMLKTLHGVNANNEQVSQAVNFYYAAIEKVEADRQEADRTAAQAAQDALHNEWGPEFRANMNAIDGLLATAPGDVKEQLKFGRLADGTPIMANADAIRWLNSLSREINPVTTLVPNAGADVSGSIEAEINAIEKDMGAPKGSPEHKAYWGDDKRQARYRALLDAKERSQKKA